MMRRMVTMLMLAGAAVMLPACGGYQLRGKVVEGTQPGVVVVDDGDPRLKSVGIGGASVEVMLDPMYVNRKTLGKVYSGGDGTFALPVGEFGAGVLEYNISVLARERNHSFAYEQMLMPGSSKRLLIVLPRGADNYQRPDDPLGESQKFLPAVK